jgi:hypothetical protein
MKEQYFDFCDGEFVFRDNQGASVDHVEAVRQSAIQSLPNLSRASSLIPALLNGWTR